MKTIKRTTQFKKDYKRVRASPRHAQDVDERLQAILGLLVEDTLLPEYCRDHVLSGNWEEHRECHIKPDVLLIYRIERNKLELVRFGSHSELFR